MVRPVLAKAIEKLAVAGEQAGFSVEQMIEMLNSGISIETLIEMITCRLGMPWIAPGPSVSPIRWVM